MSEKEILEFYNDMCEHYGDSMPNPEHEPRRFAFYVKLFKYIRNR